MKVIFFILISLFSFSISDTLYSQTIFNYRYIEVCSGKTNTVRVVLNNNNDFFTVFFFGEAETFSITDFNNGSYSEWMDRVYRDWSKYYPCSEVLSLVQETSKKVAQKNSNDVSQPLIVVSSDLAFFSPNDFRMGLGWSEVDRLSDKLVGGVGTIGTAGTYAMGYFRLNPILPNISMIENYNILWVYGNWLGNLINGIYYKYNQYGFFSFNSMTFGNMNGFGFQNNSFLLGSSVPIFSNHQISINSLLLVNYTYYEKVFKLNYWFDNAIRINPNISFIIKLSPTFGISITGNVTHRLGVDGGFVNYGIMTGAKLLF